MNSSYLPPSSPHQKQQQHNNRNTNLVNQRLQLQLQSKEKQNCVIYGSVNVLFLSIIWFDLSQKCPFNFSYLYYFEYTAAVILTLSTIYYLSCWMYYKLGVTPLTVTDAQKKLLRLDSKDSTFVVSSPASSPVRMSQNVTPVNISSLSWQTSFNDTQLSRASSNAAAYYNQMSQSFDNSSFNNLTNTGGGAEDPNISQASSYRNYKHTSNIITEEREMKEYLKRVSFIEDKTTNSVRTAGDQNSSFSNLWNSYRFNDLTALLKTSLYQLSPTSSPQSKTTRDDPHASGAGGVHKDLDTNSDELRQIPSDVLSTYVANLRMWISETILLRLVKEIDSINATLKSRGFSDIQIGSIGLERLKKTAENTQLVTLHIPTLPMIIPFLEMSTNQEYLVHRMRDLAKGKCLAEYRYNSGAAYNGPWDDHLPTDAAIIFHLFCTYLDSQLMPLPDHSRPFYNRYVIPVCDSKKSQKEILAEAKEKTKCTILCMNTMKPKMNFISDGKIHNCAYDRNNLFYVIIQFLLYIKNHNESLLEGVSLGKRGINILCCITDG